MFIDIDFENPYLPAFKQLLDRQVDEITTESGHTLKCIVDDLIIEDSLNSYGVMLIDDFSCIDKMAIDLISLINREDNHYVYDDEVTDLVKLALYNSTAYIRLLKIKDELPPSGVGDMTVIVCADVLYCVFKLLERCHIFAITPKRVKH